MAIDGTSGNDTLNGTVGDDTINGLEGNDTIVSSGGTDAVDGGAGTDTLQLAGLSGDSSGYSASALGPGIHIWNDQTGEDIFAINVEYVKFSNGELVPVAQVRASVAEADRAPVFNGFQPGVNIADSALDDFAFRSIVADGKITTGAAMFRPDGSGITLVARTDANGAPDYSFSVDGYLANSFNGNFQPLDMARMSDGTIVVVGSVTKTQGVVQWGIAHYTADGALDSAFGTNGLVTIDMNGGGFSSIPRAVAIDSQDNIVVGGYTDSTGSSDNNFALVRLTPTGALDPSFNGTGKAFVGSLGNWEALRSLVILPGDGIAAVGTSSGATQSVELLVVNADGTRDAFSSHDGLLNIPVPGLVTARALTYTSEGKYAFVGVQDDGGGVTTAFAMRYLTDGTPDLTFGDGSGMVRIPVGNGANTAYDMVVQSDGGMIVVGQATHKDGVNDGFLVRLDANGNIDTSFGDQGYVWDPFPDSSFAAYNDVTLDGDGNIIVSGSYGSEAGQNSIVLRYTSTGVLDTTFAQRSTFDGYAVAGAGGPPAWLLFSDNGVYDAEHAAVDSYAGATLTVQRDTGPDANDVFSGDVHLSFADGLVKFSGVTVGTVLNNSDGVLSIAFNGNATQEAVNGVLREIKWSNAQQETGDVHFQWLFTDGDPDASGTQSVEGSSTLHVVGYIDASSTQTSNGTGLDDVIYGGTGKDTLSGDAGNDLIVGGFSADVLNGGDGNDTILGGDDFSTLPGSNNVDTLVGGAGDDLMDGGAIKDHTNYVDANWIWFTGATEGVVVDMSGITGDGSAGFGIAHDGEGGIDRFSNVNYIKGSAYDDRIVGSSALIFEMFEGSTGNDTIDGGAIDATGQAGNRINYQNAASAETVDLLAGTASGGDGEDTLFNINQIRASSWDDTLLGSNRTDVTEFYEAREGNDSIDGRGGFDILRYDSYNKFTSGVTVDLAGTTSNDGIGGVDTFSNIEGVYGSGFADSLTGTDTTGSAIQVFRGAGGNDTIDGKGGIDRADYGSASSGIAVTLNDSGDSTALDGQNGTDTLRNIENITGGGSGDQIAGNIGNNVLDGAGGNDSLQGGGGNDTLLGGGGNDLLAGGAGSDTIDGGAGADRVDYSASTAAVVVTLSDDTIGGGTANDGLGGTDKLLNIENATGSGGNDNITGNSGDNGLDGGSGNDTLVGAAGNDFMVGGLGDDVLVGGGGNDFMVGNEGADFLTGGSGDDTIDGGGISDRLNYSDRNSISYADATVGIVMDLSGITGNGETGHGTVQDGLGGTDTVSRVNFITASKLNDSIVGSSAFIFEQFDGGAGNDTIDGGAITDLVNQTNGNRITYLGASAAVTVDLGLGKATGGGGTDKLTNFNQVRGTTFADTLIGSDTTLYSESFDGDGGSDKIDGKGGFDIVRYDGATTGITVNLALGTASDGLGGTDTLVGIEGVFGSRFNDKMTGGLAANGTSVTDGLQELFRGGAGNDTIDGGQGFDRVDYASSTSAVNVTIGATGTAQDGLGGTDTLANIEGVRGSDFDDTLTGTDAGVFESFEGGAGNDTIDGKGGIDRVDYQASTGGVSVDLRNTGVSSGGIGLDGLGGTDKLLGIENVRGSKLGDDTIIGSAGANLLEGLGGNDSFDAGIGKDTVDGGAGNDVLKLHGAFSIYTISQVTQTTVRIVNGDTLEDVTVSNVESFDFNGDVRTSQQIIGGAAAGNLTLTGTTGNDALNGLNGNDSLSGLAGNDTLNGGAGNDTLNGGAGADSMIGGLGNDVFAVDSANDVIVEQAGEGYDRADVTFTALNTYALSANIEQANALGTIATNITGNEGDNLIVGNGAANSLSGAGGNDTLDGGAGVDTLNGGFGNDTFILNVATDTVQESANAGWDKVVLAFTGTTAITYNMTADVEEAVIDKASAAVPINITGNASNNVITGNGAVNVILGGAGVDTLIGGGGNDTIRGEGQSDVIQGGLGNDLLDGGVPVDKVNLTDGNTLDYSDDLGPVKIDTAAGKATDGSGGLDTIANFQFYFGSKSSTGDVITGRAGFDANGVGFEMFEGLDGNDTIDGGTITDTNNFTDGNRISYQYASAGVTVDLQADGSGWQHASGGEGNDQLKNFNQVRGGDFDDEFYGSNSTTLSELFEGRGGNNYIDGRAGTDTIRYEGAASEDGTTGVYVDLDGVANGYYRDISNALVEANDTFDNIEGVQGSRFNDTLLGGNPNNGVASNLGLEVFRGGAGNDTIDGGQGFDRADYTTSTAAIKVDLSAGTAEDGLGGIDTLFNIEGIRGSDQGDTILGSAADFENFEGRAGNDSIVGMGGGIDRADYISSLSAVNVDLSQQRAFADGWGGNDTLVGMTDVRGSLFDDMIVGDSGNNFLSGLNGNDTLIGGAGDDRFFAGNGTADFVDGGADTDRLDFGNNLSEFVVSRSDKGLVFTRGANVVTTVNVENFHFLDQDKTLDDFLHNNLSEFPDLYNGDDSDEVIESLGGNDTVFASGGNDSIDGGSGNDSLFGEDGDDTIVGGTGNDTVSGGSGNDLLSGSEGRDLVAGGAGDDTMDGGIVTDHTNFSDGNTIDYSDDESGIVMDLQTGEVLDGFGGVDMITNFQFVYGSQFGDSIHGSTGNGFEMFEGLGGDDTIDGGQISDLINGSDSNRVNYIYATSGVQVDLSGEDGVGGGMQSATGGAGNDTLYNINQVRGSDGADTLYGSDRTDVSESFEARGGANVIDGRGGIDLLRYDNVAGPVTASLVAGTATFTGGSDSFSNIEGLFGSAFNDTLVGGNAASNALEIFRGGAGNDSINGGQGFDRVDYASSTAGVSVNFTTGSASDGLGGTDTLVGIEGVRGSDFNDTLTGGSTAALEVFEGRGGNDVINGNGLTDRVEYMSSISAVNVNLATGVAVDGWGGTDTLSNIEDVRGSAFDDVLTGNAGANGLFGAAGNDTISGGAGNDTAVGGLGDDVYTVDAALDVITEQVGEGTDRVNVALTVAGIYNLGDNIENATVTAGGTLAVGIQGNALDNVLAGNANANNLSGKDGNDSLDGGLGIDTLSGGNGNDTLNGGAGVDIMAGGEGNDEYYVDATTEVANESLTGGIDTVHLVLTAAGSYTLGAGVEKGSVDNDKAVNILGNGLDNTLTGNAANNSLSGSAGNDTIDGKGGTDTVDGGDGSADVLVLAGSAGDYQVTKNSATQTVFTKLGTTVFASGIELVKFDAGAAVDIATLNGRVGSPGNDPLSGTDLGDTLDGGAGNDTISGGAGDDTIWGGVGVDSLIGGLGTDVLDGGDGNDAYLWTPGDGDDIIAQNDTISTDVDILQIGAGITKSQVSFSRGAFTYNDLVVTLKQGTGDAATYDNITVADFFNNDAVSAGTIDQVVVLASPTSPFTQADIKAAVVAAANAGNSSGVFVGFDAGETFNGSALDDWILAGGGNDVVNASAGNDTVFGGIGNDVLIGGAGDNVLAGGAGADTLQGGGGNDTLSGGSGSDLYKFSKGDGQLVIAERYFTDDDATQSGLGPVYTITDGDAPLNADVDTLQFQAGVLESDVVARRSGSDLQLVSNGGEDVVLVRDYFSNGVLPIERVQFSSGAIWTATQIRAKVLVPTTGSDQIVGYLGNDKLFGAEGDDVIAGMAGNDTITGGAGRDFLTGGVGKDVFVLDQIASDGTEEDYISDFDAANDVIALKASIFTGLGAVGTRVGLSSRLQYDSVSGALSYDQDGAGTTYEPVVIAVIGLANTEAHPNSMGTSFLLI